jgi:ribosomal protein S2
VQDWRSSQSKTKEKNMAITDVDIKQLLEAGAHFGHKTSRWHPKMSQYIHSKRNGTHIIDLTKTVTNLENALSFLTKTAAEGKQVLLVGTKKQAQSIIKEAAAQTGMPFVTERWLGGMLTNWNTIDGRVKHLKDLEATKMKIKITAIVDTNSDPTPISFPIPANDDAIKTIQLITDYVVQAINAGKAQVKTTEVKE